MTNAERFPGLNRFILGIVIAGASLAGLWIVYFLVALVIVL
jgi:hypothetical protein